MRLFKILVTMFSIAFLVCGQKKASRSEYFINEQSKLIEAHTKILSEEGRLTPAANSYAILSQYGWHSSCGDEVGARPTWVFRCAGGSFGAYSFYQPAYEQAKRSWWINGVMETGSDLLRATSYAKFDKSIIGYDVSAISLEWDGRSEFEFIRGAKVIEVLQYPDGSIKSVVRLNKKAPRFAEQWGISITPPDYIDMCACTSASEVKK